MKTFQVHFLGCKTNQSDALSYAGILERAGWRPSGGSEPADLIILQTCTVTMSADAQGRQLARRLKKENPGAKILMTGCYAQRVESDPRRFPEVDYVIGNLNPDRFSILSAIAGKPVAEEYPDFVMPAESSRTRPYIKIQDGCDARCSYCIIPSVRGKSRSLPIMEVVRRVAYYRDRGYREMILTGISLGGYGKDLVLKTSLSKLMMELDAMEGDFRIRLSSLEPEEIDDAFIDVFTRSRRFQPHLHLPLQSASDKVLKRMRRQYLFGHYERIVNRILDAIPDLNLGTDLLVGFPEEDREAYLETRNYVQRAPFAYFHVFPFSPRPGTPAASYPPSASSQEVHERAAELRALSREKNWNYRKRFLGKNLRALILQGTEGEVLTDNYIRVKLAEPVSRGEIVTVQIDSVQEDLTIGHCVEPCVIPA